MKPLIYAAVYALRLLQLVALFLGYHYFIGLIANLATGKLLKQVLGLAACGLGFVICELALTRLQIKHPDLAARAKSAVKRRFDTELTGRARVGWLVLLFGFLAIVIGYMMICLYWNPPWLP